MIPEVAPPRLVLSPLLIVFIIPCALLIDYVSPRVVCFIFFLAFGVREFEADPPPPLTLDDTIFYSFLE